MPLQAIKRVSDVPREMWRDDILCRGSICAPTDMYVFGKHDEYEIEIAKSIEQRRRAWALVYRSYAGKGYAGANRDGLWYSLYDALPETTTFLVTRDGEDVATVTQVFDSPLGLPADKIYLPELNRMRRNGRRLFEMVSLASLETSRRGRMEVLKHMFKLAHLTAWRIEHATDWIVTVNPRYTAFYERALLFRRIGEKKTYDKVNGAPAVLLNLDVETSGPRYMEKYGTEPGSIYRHFFDPRMEGGLIRFLKLKRDIFDMETVKSWFEEKRPLLSQASPEARAYVLSRYRAYDLSASGSGSA